MSSGNAFRNLLVGLFFLGSLAILGGATLAISDVAFLSSNETVDVRFPNVDNLKAGDEVLLHGFRVGQVDDIRYEPDADPASPIRVSCSIPAQVRATLGAGTRFLIHSAGPLGGRFIEIMPAPGAPEPAEAPFRGPFRGEAPGDLFRQLENLVSTNQEGITAAVDGIRETVQDMGAIMKDIRAGQGLVGQLIKDPDLARSFEETIREIRETFGSVNRAEGPVGVLIKDRELGEKVRKAVGDLADAAAGLKTEEGTIGYLLNSAEARRKVDSTLSDIERIAHEVRDGDGLAARLINSDRLANRVEDAIAGAQEVVEKVNSGSGTIGQLINNPRAWEEIMKVLILIREAVEDLREQAPISTFVNVLFAAF